MHCSRHDAACRNSPRGADAPRLLPKGMPPPPAAVVPTRQPQMFLSCTKSRSRSVQNLREWRKQWRPSAAAKAELRPTQLLKTFSSGGAAAQSGLRQTCRMPPKLRQNGAQSRTTETYGCKTSQEPRARVLKRRMSALTVDADLFVARLEVCGCLRTGPSRRLYLESLLVPTTEE